jgi:type IV pilus assembly protein PilW
VNHLARARGASLLEVLVALGIGLLLSLAVVTLHARILHLSAETTRTADAQDTLRIALAILEYELQHAGYWGLVADAARIGGRLGDTDPLPVTVSGDCGPGWAIDLDRALEAWSGGWPLACGPFGGAAPTSGLLVLRRNDTELASPDAGVLQVQADPWSGRLVVGGEPAEAGAEVRDLVARAYYVSPRSTGDGARPSLRRKTLQRGPRVVDEEVLPGVAAMEVALGVDTDLPGTPGHGLPNRFVVPESAADPVVAVRITLQADDAAPLTMTRTVALRNGVSR